MEARIYACHESLCVDYQKDVNGSQLYIAILILSLGVVRKLFRPVCRDLLSGRNPDRSRRLGGDMVHELHLCQRWERSESYESAHLGQCREPTGFTNDSTMKTDRLSNISLVLTVRYETHHHFWRSRFTFFIELIKPKELVSDISVTGIMAMTYALIR